MPSAATVGTPLTLTAEITPSTVAYRPIIWSVYAPGTTGATIATGSNILNTTAPGTMTVRATIIDGTAIAVPLVQNAVITVTAPVVTPPGLARLDLRGPVYTWGWYDLERLTGNRTIRSAGFWHWDWVEVRGGSGNITGGNLNFSISRPTSGWMTVQNYFGFDGAEIFDHFHISAPNVQMSAISMFETYGNGSYGEIFRESWTWNPATQGYIGEWVTYIYVQQDVTISGTGRTTFMGCNCAVWDGYCPCWGCGCGGYYLTTNTFNITLRAGWNAMHMKEVEREDVRGVWTYELTVSLGDPGHLKWILEEWGGGGSPHAASCCALDRSGRAQADGSRDTRDRRSPFRARR